MVKTVPTLPSHYYFDQAHFERELEAFWFQEWICVGRFDDLSNPGDYRVVELAGQSVIVLRDSQRVIRAMHNTCRHRGSLLCERSAGHFTNGRIVCPYHAWTYGLEGNLEHTPWRLPSDDFNFGQFSLYRVGAIEWAGFVFLNFSLEEDAEAEEVLSPLINNFQNWDLQTSKVVHQMEVELACNWKVFWENFQECYHCPSVHPELCRIVPTYGEGYSSRSQNPAYAGTEEPEKRLAPEAVTWTLDGASRLPAFRGLTQEEENLGHVFGVSMPSGYFVGHVDYFRSVRMTPLAAERTQLNVDWLVPAEIGEMDAGQIEHMIGLSALVVEQDGRVCELNQKGLKSRRHDSGVLVPQESPIVKFHEYIRDGLANAVSV